MNGNIILLAKANPNEGSNSMQAPNQDTQDSSPESGGSTPEDEDEPNHKDEGIRDVTAEHQGENFFGVRARSRHSSTNRSMKGDSTKNPIKNRTVLGNHTYLLSSLTDYKNSDGKFNGIIRLIRAEYLKYCYSLIKSKPGNMSRGSTTETLDRISDK
jgi:hypothetical protein